MPNWNQIFTEIQRHAALMVAGAYSEFHCYLLIHGPCLRWSLDPAFISQVDVNREINK